jgi:uncharacterized protein (DUF736 family)
MLNIGTFTKTPNGFSGFVSTLELKNIKVQLVGIDTVNERSPHYRAYSGTAKIGAAWNKTGRESLKDYVSVTLDDPSLKEPIYANLHKADDGETYDLVWTRRDEE